MKSICVFCGSNSGSNSIYKEAAIQLARYLAGRNIKLVYGGGSIGLMGAISEAVLQQGGQVIGIIPKFLAEKELAQTNVTHLHIVDSMHERKALMAELSDGFIALPGGIGTLEELFEVYTWGQLGLHIKPCGLLNINGYYNHLISFLHHMVGEQFLKPINLDMLLIDQTPEGLLEKMAGYQSPKVNKWIESQSQT